MTPKTHGNTAQPPAGDVLTWEFGVPAVLEPAGRSLWPSEQGMPERLRRGLSTVKENGLLTATVDGPDPAFIWQFQTPTDAAALYVDAEFAEDADLQVFWMTAHCKVYQEACSTLEKATKGRHSLMLMLPTMDPIRELRLDLPEKKGVRATFHRILLSGDTTFTSPWTAYPPAQAEVGSDGLVVRSSKPDPWIHTRIAGMPATAADTVVFDVEAPSGSRAQFFWQGSECPQFDERCSVVLPKSDGGATSMSVNLRGLDTWRGHIEQLRFDPGDGPGEYRVTRVAFTNVAP